VVKVAERPGTTGNEPPHRPRFGMRPGKGARRVRMMCDDVARQTPRALLAPFQGAGAVWGVWAC